MEKIAKKHGKSPAQIVLRWHLQSGVAFIPKSVHEARIKQNIDIYNFSLTAEEMAAIDGLNDFTRVGKEPALVYEYNQKW